MDQIIRYKRWRKVALVFLDAEVSGLIDNIESAKKGEISNLQYLDSLLAVLKEKKEEFKI